MKPSRIYKPHIDAYAVNSLARQDPQKLIDFSEDRYRSQISEVAEEFAAGFPHSRIILLSGPTSSGKTTTSHNLDAELEKRGIATFALSLDDFFFDRDRAPLLPDGTRDYETPALVDTETLERCLSELLVKGSADFPIYDFKTGRRSEKTFHYDYDDHTAIIIEGLHALNPLIAGRPFFRDAKKLYISIRAEFYEGVRRVLSTRELRFIRRIIRDEHFRGSDPLSTMAMWKNVVDGEEKYIRPYRVCADKWIDSLHLYEPSLYKPAAEKLLTPCLHDPKYGVQAEDLLERLSHFAPLPRVRIPRDSLMREFLEVF